MSDHNYVEELETISYQLERIADYMAAGDGQRLNWSDLMDAFNRGIEIGKSSGTKIYGGGTGVTLTFPTTEITKA